MYYKSVNRGVSLSKPGKYTIALILGLGFIAVASGFNGIYLAVSLGLSLLVISGLLSENTIRSFEIRKTLPALANSNTPFTVEVIVSNASDRTHLFGIELLSHSLPNSTLNFRVPYLPPNQSNSCYSECSGLPRGHYEKVILSARTLYPFGFLAKYKFIEQTMDITIVPKPDLDFEKACLELLGAKLKKWQAGESFFAHRNFQFGDPLRIVDWKRSAGKDLNHWVSKQFESDKSIFQSVVEITHDLSDSYLSKVRTLLDLLHRNSVRVSLYRNQKPIATGYEDSLRALAFLPQIQSQKIENEGSPNLHIQLSPYSLEFVSK